MSLGDQQGDQQGDQRHGNEDGDKHAGYAPATLGIRGADTWSEHAEHSAAIHATSSYRFDSAEAIAARFAGDDPGLIYSRFTNPTVHQFEQRLAVLEGGEACVATSSGMSAILALCMALLKSGDHIVASAGLFGSTIGLFNNYLEKFGIAVSYAAPDQLDAWRAAIQPNTKLLFAETPTNPLCDVVDIAALSDIAHRAGAVLAIDNCFCTPALQTPLALGADLVTHSATKYLDGQGRAVGGAVVGGADAVGEQVFSFLRSAGPTMSPFNAWIFLKGLETLDLRMRAHSASAQRIADALQSSAAVKRVYYTGLESHPQHDLAAAQQRHHGGIVAFELADQQQAFSVINQLQLFTITANLGDTRSTVTHPASTTHYRIGREARARAGIADGLVRLSVGLEDVADLVDDLMQALTPVSSVSSNAAP